MSVAYFNVQTTDHDGRYQSRTVENYYADWQVITLRRLLDAAKQVADAGSTVEEGFTVTITFEQYVKTGE